MPKHESVIAGAMRFGWSRSIASSRAGRHPGDLLRIGVSGSVLGVTSASAAHGGIGRFEEDLFRLVNRLPDVLRLPLIGVMQAGSLGAVPVAAGLALAGRRPRLARDFVLSGGTAYVAARAVKAAVARERPAQLLTSIFRASADTGLGFPSGHAAVAAALAAAAGPYLGRTGRRLAWATAFTVAAARVYVGAHLPLDVVGGLALGWLVGTVVHLLLGAPDAVPSDGDVLSLIGQVVRDPLDLRRVDADARGSLPYTAVSGSGRFFAKVVTNQNRDADAMFKLMRYLALRTAEDEKPFLSCGQVVEHEAYAGMMAERAGARVPRVVGTARRHGAAVLVCDAVLAPRGLDDPSLDDDTIEGALADLWGQVTSLHRAGIAHRDLRLANVLADRDGRAWLVDFGFAQVAASGRRLAIDIAELLVSTALVVGATRALAAARHYLSPDELAAAAPFLQPLALSSATRSALRAKAKQGLLDELRDQVAAATGVEPVALQPLARVRLRTLLMVTALAFGAHLLIPQVGDLHRTLDVVTRARPWWLVAAVLASAVTYLGSGVALLGAAPVPLPYGRTVATQLAGSFVNRVTPAGLGGVGINVRYLERSGLDRATALTTVATNSIGGFLVHVVMLVVAVVATGRTGIGNVTVPTGWRLLVLAATVPAIVGVVVATPLRHKVTGPLIRATRQLAEVLKTPTRAAQLLGGGATVTVFYILSLAASLHAFAADAPLEKVAVVFLAAGAVASAAPTPGGLGAVEAALAAGLIGVGVDPAPAIAGVLSYRLATFWLPILPSWLTYRHLRRQQDL